MSLTPGARLGVYEVTASIGEGGMGQVFRATDTRLKRQVAIKILPPSLAADHDRLARFQREAEVLASLNCPHIAGIYGLEERDGISALVMELVEGQDLSQRLTRGAIPVDEALAIAKQIAEALEAAHEQGIIHRDLKPANIKVKPDGTVKVLDFGLAKAMDRASADRAMSPTITSPAMTQAGIILGTAAYMSPEQATGKPVDKRSDLWSFGVVLMEMLTGRRVFDGETVSHVIASVLKDTPNLAALPADTPASIRKLVRRCLEKDRRKRLADAADARLEIEDALTPAPAEPSSPGAWARRAPILMAFAAGAALAGTAAVLIPIGTGSRTPAASSALTYTPLSFEPGGNQSPVWSPDGKGVAFSASQREDEPLQIYVRYLDSSNSTQLTHMDVEATPVAWTTPGRIVFGSAATPAGLWSISQTGGQPEPLLAVDVGGRISAGVSLDGGRIAYYDQQEGKYGVWISDPAGSPPKRYAPAPFETDANIQARVRFSPDGKQLLLLRNAFRGVEAWLMPYPADANHPPRRIFDRTFSESTLMATASWMPDNRRLVMSIEPASGAHSLYVADAVSGGLSLLSSGTTSQRSPAVSPDGTRVAFSDYTIDYDVLQVDLRTGGVSPLLATKRNEDMPAWAMSSAAMAYVTNRTGEPEIWLHQPGRPDRAVVTARDFPPGTTSLFNSPMVSPDGTRIIYQRLQRDGASPMWLSALSGSAPVRVTNAQAEHSERPGAWSPEGAWFTYWDLVGNVTSMHRVRTTGQATPEVLVPKVDRVRNNAVPAWSPLGDWILHNSNGWRLISPDGKSERDLALNANVCAFSRDGVQLYCVRAEGVGGVLFSRLVAGGPERVIAKLRPSQVPNTQLLSLRMTLTPDGQYLTFSARKRESNLWLLGGIPETR